MIDREFITGVLTAALAPLGALWLLRRVKETGRVQNGSRVLEFSTPWRIVAVLAMFMFGIFFHPAMRSSPAGRPPNVLWDWAIWLIFFLPAVYMIFLSFVYRITWNAREIEVRMPWFSRRRVLWEDVIGCEEEGWGIGSFYRVKTRRDGNFKVHDLMHGGKAFVEEYLRQTHSAAPEFTIAEQIHMARRMRGE